MSRIKINKSISERCLLTDVTPFETPVLFSNWGSFNYLVNLEKKNTPSFIKELFSDRDYSIPYRYRIKKDTLDFRTLFLLHPKHSRKISEFYKNFDVMIIKLCQKSSFSLRAPHGIADLFIEGKSKDTDTRYVERFDETKPYASSYFTYKWFSFLYMFFESDLFNDLEKKYSKMMYLDINKFFPSIYTHSISWAVRGKQYAKELMHKDNSFGSRFDKIMQTTNYLETSGIAIGPELSRIFAEIIAQAIDLRVKAELERKKIYLDVDYFCARYIDDHYFYYNDETVLDSFMYVLEKELEKYKLYINRDKCWKENRPFITDASIKKIEMSNFINDLCNRMDNIKEKDFPKELNKVRGIVKGFGPINMLTSMYLSALLRRLRRIRYNDVSTESRAVLLFIELMFHWFRMDIRVASAYKITRLVTECLERTKKYPAHIRLRITDKLHFEIEQGIISAIASGSIIEALNLFIAAAEMGEDYSIPSKVVGKAIEKCKETYSDEFSSDERLSYFEIVTLLYYCKRKGMYSGLRVTILDEAKRIIEEYSPVQYSESAHLLLDLVACPYLEKAEKDELIDISISKHQIGSRTKVAEIRNYISKHVWYFNWNKDSNLKVLLKKKELILSY